MSPEKLVRMANQIATFFKTQPREDAAARVAGHLRDYWDPRMREALRRHVENGGEGLDEIVIGASRQL
jgi:formate dehydrogenase subunit delta